MSWNHAAAWHLGRAGRWIDLDGTVNARIVVPGVLLRSDSLQSLSRRDVRRLLVEHQLEVVLDLRTDVEVAREGPGPLVSQRTVRIEHRSLYPDLRVTGEPDANLIVPWRTPAGDQPSGEASDVRPVVRRYMNYLERRPDSIVAALQTIGAASGATLVHCAAGKDRTGVVIALALDAARIPRPAIAEDYLASAARIQAIIGRFVGSGTYGNGLEASDPGRYAPVPGTIERFLGLIDERHGGIVRWLVGHGMKAHEIDRLAQRLHPAAEHLRA